MPFVTIITVDRPVGCLCGARLQVSVLVRAVVPLTHVLCSSHPAHLPRVALSRAVVSRAARLLQRRRVRVRARGGLNVALGFCSHDQSFDVPSLGLSVFDLRSLSEKWAGSTVLWMDHYAFSAPSVVMAEQPRLRIIKLVQTVLSIEILAGESPTLIIQPQ